MIIERNVFRIKFGHMKEAVLIWKQIFDEFKNERDPLKMRMMTDLTGPSYTMVLEMRLGSLNDFGFKNYQWLSNQNAAKLYEQFKPLCESAERTLYKVEWEN